MEFTFPSEEKYLEAWGYCMRVGVGFSYSRQDRKIWTERSDDLDDDADTNNRLREIRDE